MAVSYHADGAARSFTGDDVRGFALMALRSKLGLQCVGIGFRGESPMSTVKRITGLRARSARSMAPLFDQWLITNGWMTASGKYIPRSVEP